MPSISDFVMTEQPLETGGASVYPFSSALMQKLTFENRFGDKVEMFRRDGPRLLVPRMLTPVGKEDLRIEGPKILFPKEPIPREYQVNMFNHVDQAVEDYDNGVFKASTGWGKTLIGYRAAWKAQTRTLAVTTKEDIFEQWVGGAPKFLGIDPSEVGVIRQDKCQVLDRKFVVALIQSLSIEGRYPEHIYSAFGLVLFDEVHRLPAETFGRVAYMFPARRRYGLSATLDRSDEKDILFRAHLGPVLHESTVEQNVPKVMRVKTGWACPKTTKKKKDGTTEVIKVPHEPGRTAHIDKILAVNDERNALIATLTKAAIEKGRKPVLFSTLHLHLDEIERSLLKAGIPKMKIGRYVGESTKAGKEKRTKHRDRQVLLSTFGMMSEGTSIDELDTAILCMPRSDVIQAVGRIRRLLADKRFSLVIDLVDEDSHVYKGYSMKRLKWYRSIKCQVEEW